MIMKSKFLIVLYLAIIAVLGISCENTDNEPDEDAVVTVIPNVEDGAVVKTLYLLAGDIQQPYLRKDMFQEYYYDAYEKIVYTKDNAIASAVADSEGKFTFVIDKKYLYGSIKRAFAVAEFDENGQLRRSDLLDGIASGDKVETELDFHFVLYINNVDVEVNKQGDIKVSSEIVTSSYLQQCYIATPSNDNLLYDFNEGGISANLDVYSLASPWMDFNRYGMTLYADDMDTHIEMNISEPIEYPYNSQQGWVYVNIKDNATYTVTLAELNSVDVIVDVSVDESNSIRTVIKKASLSQNAEVAAKSNKVYMFQDGQAVDEITYDGVIVTENGCICKFIDVGNFSYDNTLQMQVIKEGLGAVTKVDISQLSNQ